MFAMRAAAWAPLLLLSCTGEAPKRPVVLAEPGPKALREEGSERSPACPAGCHACEGRCCRWTKSSCADCQREKPCLWH